MDPVHDKGVHGPGPYFDGPGPRRGSMDQGSMFCTFPSCTNRLSVSVIVGVPIVILNSALTFWIKDRWCKWRNKRLTKNNQVVFFIPLKNNNCSVFGYRCAHSQSIIKSSKGTSLLINPDSYRTLSLKITVCWSPPSRPFIILFSCLIVPVESLSVKTVKNARITAWEKEMDKFIEGKWRQGWIQEFS